MMMSGIDRELLTLKRTLDCSPLHLNYGVLSKFGTNRGAISRLMFWSSFTTESLQFVDIQRRRLVHSYLESHTVGSCLVVAGS